MVSTKNISNYFCRFIDCIISEVNYGEKGWKIWASITRKELREASYKIDRYVHGKKYLLKVSFIIYCSRCSFFCKWALLYYNNSFVYWVLPLVITYLSPPYRFMVFPLQGLMGSKPFGRVPLHLHQKRYWLIWAGTGG